ncbi:dihydroxyacetone kinase subunit DhaL [Clostridium sp. DL1XJH146]
MESILKKILLPAVDLIDENIHYLTELDSATGDGDHGVTMAKIANKIKEYVNNLSGDEDLADVLDDLSWDLMNISGGSAGPLWGSFFEGMASGAKEEFSNEEELVRNLLVKAYENFSQVSGAKPGEKTMMDAIYPATMLIKDGASFDDVAKAAAEGAENTKDMLAKFGRAKSLKEKSIGHKDPGAVSFSLLYVGIAKGLNE